MRMSSAHVRTVACIYVPTSSLAVPKSISSGSSIWRCIANIHPGHQKLLPVARVKGRVNIHALSMTVRGVEVNTTEPRSCARPGDRIGGGHRGNRPPAAHPEQASEELG
jgi:hypothetical protein